MTQTLALLLDGYRELNAKRLFWVVLAISGVIVAAFAVVGVDGNQFTVAGWHVPFVVKGLSLITPATFYKFLFVYFGVGFWLSIFSVILALVSTAGIFPDFLASGSVDLYLSKPISRVRLFATKYVTGLLFVALQVTVFSAATFLVLGVRGHEWMPSVFLAVPLVTLMFSYLFAVCVVLGVLTRSTVASLLLTLLIWFVIWAAQAVEGRLLQSELSVRAEAGRLDRRAVRLEADLAAASTTAPATRPTNRPMFSIQPSARLIQQELDRVRQQRADEPIDGRTTAHRIAYAVLWPIPKTSYTTDLLANRLFRDAKLPWDRDATDDDDADYEGDPPSPPDGGRRSRGGPRFGSPGDIEDARRAAHVLHARSKGWIIGTSLGFEAVLLVFAGWQFHRRDY